MNKIMKNLSKKVAVVLSSLIMSLMESLTIIEGHSNRNVPEEQGIKQRCISACCNLVKGKTN